MLPRAVFTSSRARKRARAPEMQERCTRTDVRARARARIRKYLNLIAGHDRYIAAVISVLIMPGPPWSCRSVERGHVRLTIRGVAVRNGKVE